LKPKDLSYWYEPCMHWSIKKIPHLLRLKPYPQIKPSGTPFIKDLFVYLFTSRIPVSTCMCLSPYKMYDYFRLPESLFLYILAGYNVFCTPLLLLPMHSVFLFYVYFLLSLSFGFIEIAPETRSIRTHYKCTGIWLEFAVSWECKGAGTFRNHQKCMCKLQNLPVNGDVNRPENSATIRNAC
jgi:hypothetical protein